MIQPIDFAAQAREALARAEAAAPGPWGWTHAEDWNAEPTAEPSSPADLVRLTPGVSIGYQMIVSSGGGEYTTPSPTEAAFIAHARSDVPALAHAVLALVERTQAAERRAAEAKAACMELVAAILEFREAFRSSGEHTIPREANDRTEAIAAVRLPEGAQWLSDAKLLLAALRAVPKWPATNETMALVGQALSTDLARRLAGEARP